MTSSGLLGGNGLQEKRYHREESDAFMEITGWRVCVMMKKWMCIILSLAVLLGTGPMTAAFAEDNGITEKELTA